jgi:hypothetical protein
MVRLRSSTIGFKEWSLVCAALGTGRQSIILRKGGIAEGRGGFQWQASEFHLFPTRFHEQERLVRWSAPADLREDHAAPSSVVLRFVAKVEHTASLSDWSVAAKLEPFHIWSEPVIRERFGYGDSTGLSLALVRVFRLDDPWVLPMEPRFGGCRSWLDLPEHPESELIPVLDDRVHGEVAGAVAAVLAAA